MSHMQLRIRRIDLIDWLIFIDLVLAALLSYGLHFLDKILLIYSCTSQISVSDYLQAIDKVLVILTICSLKMLKALRNHS